MRISAVNNELAKETASRKRNLSEHPSSKGNSCDGNQHSITGVDCVSRTQRAMFNSQYQIARGIHNSPLGLARNDGNGYGQISYRKSLGETDKPNMMRSRVALLESSEKYLMNPDVHFCEENIGWSRGVESKVTRQNEGWSRVALQAVNAVAEKAWEFCKISAAIFRGFHAGGGTKYKVSNPGEAKLTFEPVRRQDWFQRPDSVDRDIESCSIFHESTGEQTPARPAKRRQISANHDSLEKNWVVVAPTTTTSIKPLRTPPKCGIPVSTSTKRKPTYASNTYNSASQAGSISSPSLRKPSLPSQKPCSSHAGPPALSPYQRASFASPRSPSIYSSSPTTPRSASFQRQKSDLFLDTPTAVEAKREAQRWAVSLKNEERKQDESIQRLDLRLKAMIREGKEALSTQIQVNKNDNQSRAVNSKVKRWRY